MVHDRSKGKGKKGKYYQEEEYGTGVWIGRPAHKGGDRWIYWRYFERADEVQGRLDEDLPEGQEAEEEDYIIEDETSTDDDADDAEEGPERPQQPPPGGPGGGASGTQVVRVEAEPEPRTPMPGFVVSATIGDIQADVENLEHYVWRSSLAPTRWSEHQEIRRRSCQYKRKQALYNEAGKLIQSREWIRKDIFKRAMQRTRIEREASSAIRHREYERVVKELEEPTESPRRDEDVKEAQMKYTREEAEARKRQEDQPFDRHEYEIAKSQLWPGAILEAWKDGVMEHIKRTMELHGSVGIPTSEEWVLLMRAWRKHMEDAGAERNPHVWTTPVSYTHLRAHET